MGNVQNRAEELNSVNLSKFGTTDPTQQRPMQQSFALEFSFAIADSDSSTITPDRNLELII